jgi:hypothetical protein
MKNISANMLSSVTGGALTTAPVRRSSSSSSNTTLQTALTGVTSALDSLKANQNTGGINQLLPVALMARWIRQG